MLVATVLALRYHVSKYFNPIELTEEFSMTRTPKIVLSVLISLFLSANAFADAQVISTLINELNRSFDASVQTELVRTLKSQ